MSAPRKNTVSSEIEIGMSRLYANDPNDLSSSAASATANKLCRDNWLAKPTADVDS